MRPSLRPLIAAWLIIATARRGEAQVADRLSDSAVVAIDRLFAPWSGPGSPGCAVGVFQRGRIVFARGYGFANLNHDVPITPSTVFTVGSVSKQFTAASIALLVRAGRLSLDDAVRTFVPSLPSYASPVTVRHLVHHTSGLRDFWELVDLAGLRPDDGYRVDDMLAMVNRQRGLNFAPGSEYRYSNTGYLLLGVIVQRVTGQSLRVFADSAIFRPLGMRDTHFLDDHNEVVPRRAMAYSPDGGRFRINVWNNDLVGQGGIVTSLADLQRWDENFYGAAMGGAAFLALMRSLDPLNGGAPNDYAFGLTIGTYRGRRVESHTGATGGYRAALYRFPDTHSSVALLCNDSDVNTGSLSLAVADQVFGMQPVARTATRSADAVPSRASVPIGTIPASLDAVAGTYRSDELLGAEWVVVTDSADGIVVHRPRHGPARFRATGARAFAPSAGQSSDASGLLLTFEPELSGRSPGFVVNGDRVNGVRFSRVVP